MKRETRPSVELENMEQYVCYTLTEVLTKFFEKPYSQRPLLDIRVIQFEINNHFSHLSATSETSYFHSSTFERASKRNSKRFIQLMLLSGQSSTEASE
jgi:hypothetical protein